MTMNIVEFNQLAKETLGQYFKWLKVSICIYTKRDVIQYCIIGVPNGFHKGQILRYKGANPQNVINEALAQELEAIEEDKLQYSLLHNDGQAEDQYPDQD